MDFSSGLHDQITDMHHMRQKKIELLVRWTEKSHRRKVTEIKSHKKVTGKIVTKS